MARREPDRRAQGLGSPSLVRGLLALAAGLAGLIVWATFIEPQRVGLERVEVPCAGLAPDLDGLTILQVSDLESRGRGRREAAVAALAREARADVVVVTGDLVAKTLRGEARARAAREVGALVGEIPSRYGAFFVEGHGEHYQGAGRRELLEALEARGVRFLHDEIETIPVGGTALTIVGLALHPAGRDAVFFQKPDGMIVENGASRADAYLQLRAPSLANATDYEFSGRFRFSRDDAGVGVTFYDRMPMGEDRYYRLRRTETGGVLKLSPHGTVFSRGRSASGVSPGPGPWVAFRIRAETQDSATRVRARAWLADDPEPAEWPIDCLDATETRPPGGTVGLWTSGSGRKEFEGLTVEALDGRPLVRDGRGVGPEPGRWEAPAAPDWMLSLDGRLPAGGFVVALSHTPDPFRWTPALGWPLLLAGHTQGGQIRVPFLGALTTDSTLGRKFAAGLFERDGARLYITRGIGTSRVPFRFLSPPELTLLTLRRSGATPHGRSSGAGGPR